MYRKYVRKWWLLKRNRIICQDVAVNGQFVPGNSKFCLKLIEKSKFFGNLPGKIKIFWWNCLKKSKFFKNLPAWKNWIFLTRIHDPMHGKPMRNLYEIDYWSSLSTKKPLKTTIFLCAGKNNSSRKNPPSKIHRAHTVQQCNTTQCINIQYIHSHNYR